MARASLFGSTASHDSGSNKTSWGLMFTCIRPQYLVPRYSNVTDARVSVEVAQNSTVSKGKCYIQINNDPKIYDKSGVVAYDYDAKTPDFMDLIYTSGENSGRLKNDPGEFKVTVMLSYTFSRKWYLRNFNCYIDYDPPIYNLNLSSNNTSYGTVTGGGSFELQVEDYNVTISATPKSGYKFVRWSDGNTNATRSITLSADSITSHTTTNSLTATFEPDGPVYYTVNFRNADGSIMETRSVENDTAVGSLPVPTRDGYAFNGWIASAPVKKTDGTVLDSYIYDGTMAFPIAQSYKYTDKFSLHLEAYMDDWSEIQNGSMQLISCTQSGGWGLGYAANTVGHGVEVYSGGYIGIDLGFGTTLTGSGWKEFDVIYNAGTLKAYVDGTLINTVTGSGSSITYNSNNTIFVGAEAGSNSSTPDGNYFRGIISNVFIANSSSRLTNPTKNTKITANKNYYPVWQKIGSINNIYVGGSKIKDIYVGTTKVKAVYVGTTKIYG